MENESSWQSVFHTISILLATVVQESLQKAGYTCFIKKIEDGQFHVFVRKSEFKSAHRTLFTDPKHGEIFNGSPD